MEDRSSRWVIEEKVEPDTPKPEWFENAVGTAPTSHRVTVEGCPIHYLRWGPETSEKPGLLFVHGGAAHAQWWSFIAPLFAEDRPMLQLNLRRAMLSLHHDQLLHEPPTGEREAKYVPTASSALRLHTALELDATYLNMNINVLEPRGVVGLLKHLKRTGVPPGRVLSLVDSLVAIGCASKGRPSSRGLTEPSASLRAADCWLIQTTSSACAALSSTRSSAGARRPCAKVSSRKASRPQMPLLQSTANSLAAA